MGQAAEYDYVVVGAGTAGSVLAARLSEDSAARVLLVEAGSAREPELMAVPPAWPSLLGTFRNWGEPTSRQTATGSAVPLARGRGLGGSSAINAMVHTRGHRSSYDAWPALGAAGWGFDDLLPYLKRSETAAGRDPEVRGQDGPLTPGPARPPNPVLAACLDAAAEVGHPSASDISSGVQEGFGWPDLNIADGRRQSAADAYLRPVFGRGNLRVVTDALVHRVLVEGDRCTGVSYRTEQGEEVTVRATREVVLAAGAIGTAHLLLLSGIGPEEHLRAKGVDVVHHLPGVGGNLQDHVMAGVVYSAARPLPESPFPRALRRAVRARADEPLSANAGALGPASAGRVPYRLFGGCAPKALERVVRWSVGATGRADRRGNPHEGTPVCGLPGGTTRTGAPLPAASSSGRPPERAPLSAASSSGGPPRS